MIEQVTESNAMLTKGYVTSPKGFNAGGLHCGIKRKRPDLGWLVSEIPATAAAVYTTNHFQAAPLQVTKESIAANPQLKAVIVNSGVANACTGKEGLNNAYAMRQLFSEHLSVSDLDIAVVSTGLIGTQLPMENIIHGVGQIAENTQDPEQFGRSILTTDTFTKHAAVEMTIDGKTVTIGGVAKGSGMIHPNMATMLGFITTDANVAQTDLLKALKTVTNDTFNMITVDGDTSTNDMVLTLANGMAENDQLTASHPQWPVFLEGLKKVSETLAKQIARDGEGATKLIEVEVKGASNNTTAQAISKAIVGSSLVKTAVYGTDPNWGRIVGAIGYAGQPINTETITVSIGPITVVDNGLPTPFNEKEASAYLTQENISIQVDLDDGPGHATAWGCDLTYDYVKINASYRT